MRATLLLVAILVLVANAYAVVELRPVCPHAVDAGSEFEITIEAYENNEAVEWSGAVRVTVNGSVTIDGADFAIFNFDDEMESTRKFVSNFVGTSTVSLQDFDSQLIDVTGTCMFEMERHATYLLITTDIVSNSDVISGEKVVLTVQAYAEGEQKTTRYNNAIGLTRTCDSTDDEPVLVAVLDVMDGMASYNVRQDLEEGNDNDLCIYGMTDVADDIVDLSSTTTVNWYRDMCISSPCLNGGTCTTKPGPPALVMCNCPSAWTGDVCDEDVDECSNDVCAAKPQTTCLNTIGAYVCANYEPVQQPLAAPIVLSVTNDEDYETVVANIDNAVENLCSKTITFLCASNPTFCILTRENCVFVGISPGSVIYNFYITDPGSTSTDDNQAKTDASLTTISDAGLNNYVTAVFGADVAAEGISKVPNPLPIFPFHPAQRVTFFDTDSTLNRIAGTITIAAAASESDVDEYQIFWASSQSNLISQYGLVAAAGLPEYELKVPDNTALPAGALFFVVRTANGVGTMKTGVSTLIDDLDCAEWLTNQREWAVAASSVRVVGREADNTMDSTPFSYWQASTNSDEWIIYDFGVEMLLSTVRVTPRLDRVKDVYIQQWVSDTEEWKNIATFEVAREDPTSVEFTIAKVQRLRLFVVDTWDGEGDRVAIQEVNFFGTRARTSNVALDVGLVDSTSSQPSSENSFMVPSLAIDGDLTTRWRAGLSGSGPIYLVIDLGVEHILTEMTIYPDGNRMRRGKLQRAATVVGSGDLHLWGLVSSVTVPVDTSEEIGYTSSFEATQTRFLRLQITNGHVKNQAMGIREMTLVGYPALSQEIQGVDAAWAMSVSSGPKRSGKTKELLAIHLATHQAKAAFDGDYDTWWQTSSDSDEWVTIDTQAPIALTAIELFIKRERIRQVQFQKLGTDGQWETVAAFTVPSQPEVSADRYVFKAQFDNVPLERFASTMIAPVSQYWRLRGVDSYDFKIGLKDIKFYGPSRRFDNLNPIASGPNSWAYAVSSQDGTDGKDNVLDGDENTVWQADDSSDQWIQFNMQSEHQLAYVFLDLQGRSGIQNAILQQAPDVTGPWTQLAVFAVPEAVQSYTIVLGTNIAVQHLRLFVQNSHDGRFIQLTNIAFYSDVTKYCPNNGL